MKNFFLSLKTTVWTLLILICLFFLGSYMMPVYREVFSPMNDGLLFQWIEAVAAFNLWQSWWFFAALAGLVLLTINTLVCSIQAIRAKWSRSDFLLRVSPQVIHTGFLFILLAHLMSAGWGYKVSGTLPEGATARLPEGRAVSLQKIDVRTDSRGFMTDWAAAVSLYEHGEVVRTGVLGPNRPLLYHGTAIYLKSVDVDPVPSAFLLVARDPGAIWALAGGVLFSLGSVVLLLLKWKQA